MACGGTTGSCRTTCARMTRANTKRRLGSVLALVTAFISAPGAAEGQVSAAKIDSVFAFVQAHDPGCAVLVIKDGKPVYRRGFGLAELRGARRINAETNFRLASLTKQFTAMAIMLLVHDGKLRYEEHLTEIFPDFPAYGKTITIRHVLNHTSGLIDYEDIMAKQYAGIADEKIPQISDAGVLALLKKETGTKFAPGTRWAYSNSGYVLLAQVVEKRSGMRFGDFLRERIFEPLEMTGTIAHVKGKDEVSHRAYGYTRVAGKWRQTDQSSTSATLGDGGVYTSLNDLEKWNRALDNHTLLAAKEMQAALNPGTASNGAPLQQVDGSLAPLYGFGWFLDPLHGHRRYSHYGETVGFRNAIQRFPDDRLSVIVLSNRAEVDAPALAQKVADLYLAKR